MNTLAMFVGYASMAFLGLCLLYASWQYITDLYMYYFVYGPAWKKDVEHVEQAKKLAKLRDTHWVEEYNQIRERYYKRNNWL